MNLFMLRCLLSIGFATLIWATMGFFHLTAEDVFTGVLLMYGYEISKGWVKNDK